MLIAHGTHPGETGKNNEDRHTLVTLETPAGPAFLAVVADGIGGHVAGEVASEMAVEIITAGVREHLAQGPRPALEQALTVAARRIAQAAAAEPEQRGMGTTCAVALAVENQLYIACIGDSRIYLMRGNTLQQISVDHTFVQEAVERGYLTPGEARLSPQRHVVYRHLGKDPEAKPDFRLRLAAGESAEQSEQNQGLLLAAGDTVLLCSDGLSDLVEADEIGSAILQHEPQASVDELIALARQRGGYDNITVVVMRVA